MRFTKVVDATTIADAWFQCIYEIGNTLVGCHSPYVYKQPVQRGSFEGSYRHQFYSAAIAIAHPDEDMVPAMPLGVPPPTSAEYIQDYFVNYLMRAELQKDEQYTYGSRIRVSLDTIIEMLRKTPFTNQAIIRVAQPDDYLLADPPCLQTLDFKLLDIGGWQSLSVTVYFRSWDLWAGFPTNLGGIELLKQHVAHEAGLENGPMFAYSSGLHIYSHCEDVVKLRIGK